MIIDSHLHISYPEREKGDFLDVKKRLLDSMNKFKIAYSIVIPDNLPNTGCADMKRVLEIIDGENKFFLMGVIDIFQDIEKQIVNLRSLIKTQKICAIKLFPGHEPFYPTDKRCRLIYELCVDSNLPVVFHTGANSGDFTCAKYNDPKYLVEISENYKNLKIVIAHFFWPEIEYCYQSTKKFKNIYYDISAMADEDVVLSSGGWSKVVSVLKKTALLKPNNVLFGTDWPMCPVGKHIQLVEDLKLDYQAKENIFSTNAINLYKLKII